MVARVEDTSVGSSFSYSGLKSLVVNSFSSSIQLAQRPEGDLEAMRRRGEARRKVQEEVPTTGTQTEMARKAARDQRARNKAQADCIRQIEIDTGATATSAETARLCPN